MFGPVPGIKMNISATFANSFAVDHSMVIFMLHFHYFVRFGIEEVLISVHLTLSWCLGMDELR